MPTIFLHKVGLIFMMSKGKCTKSAEKGQRRGGLLLAEEIPKSCMEKKVSVESCEDDQDSAVWSWKENSGKKTGREVKQCEAQNSNCESR